MPKNLQVLDIKPKNLQVVDTKPRLVKTRSELTRSYQVVLGQNMYAGLPFIPFYRDAGTVTQWSEVG